MRHLRLCALGAVLCLIAAAVPEAWALPIWHLVGGAQIVFSAPLHTDEIGPGVWSVSGVSAPTVQWWADDPLGAGGQTTHAFTATGAPSEVATPFCNSSGTCWKARHFDMTNWYVSDSASLLDISGGIDLTVCAIVQGTPGANSGYFASRDNATNEGWYFQNGASVNAYGMVQTSGGAFNRTQGLAADWSFICLVIDYGSTIQVCNNGTLSTTQAWTAGTITASSGLVIGATEASGAGPFPGDVAAGFGWPGSALAEAQLDAVFNALQAMSARAGPDATFDRNSTAWALDASGQYQAFGQDMAAQTEDGISIWSAVTNYCSDSLDWSARAAVGVPVVTTDTTSGPLSSYNGAAEADTITDDDGGGYEGVQIAAETTYTGAYTASAFVHAGTETGATIDIQTDGTGSKTCTYSGLDTPATATTVGGSISYVDLPTGWARIICSATIGGVPSATTADLDVGDAAADTGTLIASAGQAERAAFAGRPCLEMAGGASATCNLDNVQITPTGWPVGHGRIELTYTPEVADGFGGNRCMIDAQDAATNYGWGLKINGTTGVLQWLSESVAGAGTASDSAGLTWTAGTTYEIAIQWWGNGIVKGWVDGALRIDDTGADVPDAIDATVYLGSHNAGAYQPGAGSISNVEVKR